MEPPEYPHPSLEPCLRSTFGLVVYEEHILQICEAFAGLKPSVEFMAGVVTNAKGFYHPLVYVLECHRLGIGLLAPTVNRPGPRICGRARQDPRAGRAREGAHPTDC